MDVSTLNRRHYEDANTIIFYAGYQSLFIEEEAILQKYNSFFHDKKVLDLGCGAGRTTEALLKLTTEYIGLDYSVGMVASCQKRFPDVHFVHADASELNPFRDCQFDCVMFSFNGIDCMLHEQRLKCLAEVYRVLNPGGLFVFSSHNRDYNRKVIAFDRWNLSIRHNYHNIRSYLIVKKYQVLDETFEILSDPLAGFGHLTYYIYVSDQIEQINKAGFRHLEIFNRKAKSLKSTDRDRDSNFLYYVCVKPEIQSEISPS